MQHEKEFLRRRQVEARTGLKTSTLYTLMSEGKFPRPVKLGERMVAWPATEIAEWQESKIAERDHDRP